MNDLFGAPAVDDCDLDEFIEIVSTITAQEQVPHAASISCGAVIYDAPGLRAKLATQKTSEAKLKAELAWVLSAGPGIFVVRNAVDPHVIALVNEVFFAIVADQRASNSAAGDHFGAAGVNDRIWNALEKLTVRDPEAFVAYYTNDFIALGAEAWLGPMYQMTSQVNVVNPGGAAQKPHRDYHLGFLTDEVGQQFPLHAHLMSPSLTLQGAVAHCDMPIETGPTTYLPHSHKYPLGYLAWRRPEFADYYEAHCTQVPLQTGDLVFFNPALFHAAGTNVTTDVRRIANLLQVNSAFGRAMESIDRQRMSVAIYPALVSAAEAGVPSEALHRAIASCAEGYAFPTNLDRDQPIGRLTPESQAEIVSALLDRRASAGELRIALESHAAKRLTN
jgi:ectoine hydroxylase-related dioxygenase (phytanoyl-CoA dioxygenase family)